MFSIGVFSRLTQLSVRVLRHYDQIGLLRPAHTSRANGYRYYSAEQLADANRIIALKELGLSLEQVQKITRERCSSEAIAAMLRLEQARAEQDRADAERRVRDIERRLQEIAEHGALSSIDVIEKSIAASPFLSFRTTVPTVDDAYELMGEVVAQCKPLGPWTPLVAVAHDAFFDTENLDLELGYAVHHVHDVELGAGRRMRAGTLPAVERMLTVTYTGTQAEAHRRCHNALGMWLDAHACELHGPGRELVHDTGEGREPIVEIQYPIADRTSAP